MDMVLKNSFYNWQNVLTLQIWWLWNFLIDPVQFDAALIWVLQSSSCICNKSLTLTPSSAKAILIISACCLGQSHISIPYQIKGEFASPRLWCSSWDICWYARGPEIDPCRQQYQNFMLIFPQVFRTGILKTKPPGSARIYIKVDRAISCAVAQFVHHPLWNKCQLTQTSCETWHCYVFSYAAG